MDDGQSHFGAEGRQNEWTDSIAVGGKSFIEKVKSLSGFKAKERDVIEDRGGIISVRKLLPIRPFSGPKRTI